MALDLKPNLGVENSIVVAMASAVAVISVYNQTVGPVADVHATSANDVNLSMSVKKAGWLSILLVTGIALLAKDANIVILGGSAIILEEVCYRHALATSPTTGRMVTGPAAYQPTGVNGNGIPSYAG